MQTTNKSSTSFVDGMFEFSSREAGGSMTSCEIMGFKRTCERQLKLKSAKRQPINEMSIELGHVKNENSNIFGPKFQRDWNQVIHVSN